MSSAAPVDPLIQFLSCLFTVNLEVPPSSSLEPEEPHLKTVFETLAIPNVEKGFAELKYFVRMSCVKEIAKEVALDIFQDLKAMWTAYKLYEMDTIKTNCNECSADTNPQEKYQIYKQAADRVIEKLKGHALSCAYTDEKGRGENQWVKLS